MIEIKELSKRELKEIKEDGTYHLLAEEHQQKVDEREKELTTYPRIAGYGFNQRGAFDRDGSPQSFDRFFSTIKGAKKFKRGEKRRGYWNAWRPPLTIIETDDQKYRSIYGLKEEITE